MLVKTDNQNYTDIADSLREIGCWVNIFNQNVTCSEHRDGIYYDADDLFIENPNNRQDELFKVTCNNVEYDCVLKFVNWYSFTTYHLGNWSLIDSTVIDTGEPFAIVIVDENDYKKTYIYTREVGTYNFAVQKRTFKPSEMKKALDSKFADYGISYSSDGKTATTYGYKVVGFAGCDLRDDITTINFSPRAKEIGEYAFCKTQDNYFTLTLPEGIEKLCYGSFYSSSILNVVLPSTLKEIGSYSFYECFYMKNIAIPNGVIKIGDYAFYGTSMSGVTSLPESVTELGKYAFYNSHISITSVPKGVTKIPNYVFRDGYMTSFTFHEDIEEVGYAAFACCSDLRTVTFKGKPNKIDASVWADRCESLTTINVPWSEGEVANAPWGATNATINYNYSG